MTDSRFHRLRMALRRVLHEPDTRSGRIFDTVLQGLILLSLSALTVASLKGLAGWAVTLLFVIEVVTMGFFTAEYILRVWTAPNARRYIFSFWGVVDFLAVFPYYVFNDSQWVRALRFLRIFRLLRFNRSLGRFAAAFRASRNELVVFGTTAVIMLFIAAAGIYQFEHEAQPEAFGSIPESLWWAIVTLTTVGYGDVYPITPMGRIFTGFIMIIGLGVVAGFTGVIASALSRIRDDH